MKVLYLLLFSVVIAGCTKEKEKEVMAELGCTFSMMPMLMAFLAQITLVIVLAAVSSTGAKKGLTIANAVLIPFNLMAMFAMHSSCFNDYNEGRIMPTFYIVVDAIAILAFFVVLFINSNNKKTV